MEFRNKKQIFKDNIVWGLVLGIKTLIIYQMGSVLFLYLEKKPVDKFVFVSPSRNFWLFN